MVEKDLPHVGDQNAAPLNHAAYHGHRRVAEFLLAAGAAPTADATDDAVRGGHLSLATWINAKAAHAAREREVAELAAKRERLAEVAERKAEYARLQRCLLYTSPSPRD